MTFELSKTMNKSDELMRLSFDLRSRPFGLVLFEGALFVVLQFLTITGNSLTLYVIWKTPKLCTTYNYFVASLAVSDLGMGALSEHLLLATLIMSRWPFNQEVCQYQGIVAITMASASTQTLAWTALNRYFKIVKTKYYSKIFTRRKLTAILASIWLLSLLANCPYLFAGYKFVFHPGKFFCYMTLEVTWMTAFLVATYVGIPTIVIMFCYFKVFQTVKRHNSSAVSSLSVEEINITRTLFTIVVVFVGCWTPILIMDLIDTIRGEWSLSRSAYASYTFLGTLSSSVNPFIYAFGNQAFRDEYRKVLHSSCESLTKVFCWVRNRVSVARGLRNVGSKQARRTGKDVSIQIHRVKEFRDACYEQGEISSDELNPRKTEISTPNQ